MKALTMVFFMIFICAWVIHIYDLDANPDEGLMDRAISQNFVDWRQAVIKYDFHTKDPADHVISRQMINDYLPDGFMDLSNVTWNARIHNGFVYVWGSASHLQIDLVKEALRYSLAVGEAQNGLLQPAGVALPNFIPNGSLVSATGSNRYKPENVY